MARRRKVLMPTAMPATAVRGPLLDVEAMAPAGLEGKGRLEMKAVCEAPCTDSVAVTLTSTETETLTLSVLDGVSLWDIEEVVILVGEVMPLPSPVLEPSVVAVNDPVEGTVNEMVKVEISLEEVKVAISLAEV